MNEEVKSTNSFEHYDDPLKEIMNTDNDWIQCPYAIKRRPSI